MHRIPRLESYTPPSSTETFLGSHGCSPLIVAMVDPSYQQIIVAFDSLVSD